MNISSILAQREQTHGDFKTVASFAQTLKNIIRSSPNWPRIDYVQAQVLDAHADKIARILCGDHTHLDHWQDLAGYAALSVRDLEEAQGVAPSPPMPRAPSMPTRDNDAPLDAPAFLTENRA